jgi:hypothetical protein
VVKVCLFVLLIVFVSCKDKGRIGVSTRAVEIKEGYSHILPIDCLGIQWDTISVPPNIQELIDKYHLHIIYVNGKWSMIYTDS